MKWLISKKERMPMQRPPFDLIQPDETGTAVIFASPHSGREYPAAFVESAQLDELALRSSEDAFVDRLYGAAPEYGAPLLAARVPRAVVDFNRAPDELDPALIEGVRTPRRNPRVASGLGVIPRVVAAGRQIRCGKMALDEANQRLQNFYFPYHAALRDLVSSAQARFGFAVLIDCHSMPREALTNSAYAFKRRPDVVLGDRFGTTCAPEIMDAIESIFQEAGLNTARNLPFAGAHVIAAYGLPQKGQHAVQVEIDRSLYMNERLIEPRADFPEFQAKMTDIVRRLADLGRQEWKIAAQ